MTTPVLVPSFAHATFIHQSRTVISPCCACAISLPVSTSHAHDSPLSYSHFVCLFTCFPIVSTWTVAVMWRRCASFVPSSIWFRTTHHTLLYVHLNCNLKINGNLLDPVKSRNCFNHVLEIIVVSSLIVIKWIYDPFTGRTLSPVLECATSQNHDLHHAFSYRDIQHAQ